MKKVRIASATFGQKCMHVFFGVCTVFIVTTLMLPQTFGFQDFRQWAGMYVDNWCQVTVSDGPPDSPGVKQLQSIVGKLGLSNPVWTAPSHNQVSCARWAKEVMCGKVTSDGWTATYVRPFFAHERYYLGDINICDYQFPSDRPWFLYEKN
jgi:hypothetical protein